MERKMNQFINRLPIELFYHILSYSYEVQPSNLQKDIISFSKNKKEVVDILYNRLKTDTTTIYRHLSFHIQCFLVGLPNTYEKCKNKISNVYKRLFIWDKFDMENKINQHLSYRVFWGLLTVEEREQFVEIQTNMDLNRMP